MSPGKSSILLTLALVSGVGGYVYWSNQSTPSAPLKPISAPVITPPPAVVAPTAPLEHPPFSQSELEPFLEANCIACHGPDKQKGKVRFDSASWSLDKRDSVEFWSEVLTVLEDGEMPPEEEPRKNASRERDKKCSELFAHFLDRLKEAKDSDGSRLYDNCIVSYGTNLRTGHQLKNLPAIVAGGGAKNLRKGEHIILSKRDTPLANYWLTLLQQADVPAKQFSHSTGNLPEILT